MAGVTQKSSPITMIWSISFEVNRDSERILSYFCPENLFTRKLVSFIFETIHIFFLEKSGL